MILVIYASTFFQMITDGWFLLPEDAAVRLHTKYTKQPVYYFLFGYRGTASFGTAFGDPTYDYGNSLVVLFKYFLNFDLANFSFCLIF